ncbi:MAG: hypothetical protein ACUZ9M_06890 [Candidatus Scalindua sp.]
MNEFVSNSGRGVEGIDFVFGFYVEGASRAREACSWRDCVSSASAVSRVDGCGIL